MPRQLRAPARLQSEARFPSRFTVVDSTWNRELINTAQCVLKPHTVGGRLFGNVASVLITATGNRFSGVCIDTGSGPVFVLSTAPSPPWSRLASPDRQDRRRLA